MKKPNVVLYVMDCLRADRLGCYGYASGHTPNLDRLASDSLLFERAYSQDTWTFPSAASMLSGLYPSALGIHSVHDTLAINAPWLPTAMQDSGYVTACFSGNLLLSEVFGFKRGFDHFVDQFTDHELVSQRLPVVIQSRDKKVLERYIDLEDLVLVTSSDLHRAFLKSASEHLDSPFFALIWSMDTHDPYFDRSELALGRPKRLYFQPEIVAEDAPAKRAEYSSLYDAMISYNDRTFGDLMHQLDALGLYEDTVVILCGDHGEAFGEHGVMTHSDRPHSVLTHVPLLIRLPHSKEAGKRSSELVQLTDLFPTLMDYVQLDPEDITKLQGKSLLNSRQTRDAAWSEGSGYVSLRTQRWLFMQWHSRRPRGLHQRGLREFLKTIRSISLFDLVTDPEETENLRFRQVHQLSGLTLEAQRILTRSQQIFQKLEFRERATPLDISVEDRLRALGYLG